MKISWAVVSWLIAVGVLSAQTQALPSGDTYIQESVSVGDGLSSNFYLSSCPQLESIVRENTVALLNADITQAAGLLRLQFHDCFVQGCDASVLLNGTANDPSEQTAPPNLSLRPPAIALINQIKKIVEAKCPLTVSCADIVTLASREAILKAGGPFIPFPLGRRDSLTHATVNEVLNNLPGFTLNTTQLLTSFASKNLNLFDLVALSGGHTIGKGHCAAFTNRLYPQQDPTLENSFAKLLYKICPTPNSGNTTNLDHQSPNLFDNKYYVNLVAMQGLFTSDETLYTDSRTRELVLLYAMNMQAFFQQFSISMIKMSMVGVLTGSNGQIRRQCNVPNANSDAILQVTEDEPSYTAM